MLRRSFGILSAACPALARHAGVVILGREIPSDLGRDPLPLLRRLSAVVPISVISYGDSSDLDRTYRENISGLFVTLARGELEVGSASKP